MPKKYQTFAEQFYLEEASLLQRLGRDLRLLRWMAQTIRMWFKAKPFRAEFEHCRAVNQPFYVDRFAGPPAEPASDPVDDSTSQNQPASRATQAKR
ncbi:MAG: hypothetical protein SH820_16480 [Xanthomonadales bacterium]|nr:hypothetical protein [Xanthomonadales bacterium]